MLADLLELSRVRRVDHHPVDVDIGEVVRDACELLAGQIGARGVEVAIDTGAAHVRVDRSRALQVFQNIIENTVKCMDQPALPRIEITCRERDRCVVTSVRDNGIGIAQAHLGRIFEPFEKLDPKAENTSVGLALVRGIVEAHGGKVWVESKRPGKGSVFTCSCRLGLGELDRELLPRRHTIAGA